MATSLNASLNVTLNPQSLNQASRQVQQALGRITGQASEFQKSLDASTARVFAFGATTVVLNGVTQSFKKLVSTTIEVEKRLLEINSIFQATEVTFNRFRNSIFNVAKETGQSFNTVAEGAAELARQGLSAEETASRLKSALVLTRISGMDAEKSVKALTAAINGFSSAGLKHNEIVNKMVAVDTAFAVSTEDLAEAFSRAGSTAEDAGVSFDQLLGLVTAVEQRTARGGAVIGNAFKSIFTRLARGTTIGKLQELGVQIDATQSGVQKLKALSDALETVGDPTVAAKIKELAGGVFQINVVSAALKDIGSESSIFANATKASVGAVNEAFEKNAMLSEGMAHQINALVQGLTSLAEKVGSLTFGPLLENLIGVADTFVGFLDKALDPEKGNVFIKGFFKAIGTFLSGPAVVMFTGAFIKIFGLVAKFAKEGLSSLLKMGTQADRVRTIEAGIVGLLQRDENLRNQINSSTITQAQKEQLVIDAIRQENTLLSQQASIMRGLATAAAMRGVGGFGPTGFTGRKGKGRFSMGFRAEEAEARALGAPAGVRARLSEGTIGGERAIINNHETEIRNFAGGRDSAIIPHYAGGFVPNYSRRNLNSIINSTRKKGEFGYKTPAEKEAARKKLAEMDKRAADKANMKRLPLTGAGKGMFVPLLNYKDTVKAHQGTFKKGKHTIPYDLQGSFKVRGPQLPSGIEAAGDPEDDRLKDNVIKDIAKRSRQFSNTLTPITKRNAASTAEVKKALMEQGGGKGAIHAAIGAAFEAAVVTGLKLKNKQKKKGGDFDVRPVTEKIRELFYGEGQAKSTALGDFKSSDSPDNRVSFIKKIANEKYRNKSSLMLAALGRKSKARGYIPNYAAAGGVPVSMMRVHKDDKGETVALSNIRDEPNGLQDAVKRERQGIGMFAGGFIPNYHGKDPFNIGPNPFDKERARIAAGQASKSNPKLEKSASKTSKSLEKLNKSSDKAGKGMAGVGDKSTALMGAMFAATTVLGTFTAKAEQEVQSRRAREEKELEGIQNMKIEASEKAKLMRVEMQKTAQVEQSAKKLEDFSEAVQLAISALMTMQTLNMMTGGGLGRGARGLMNSRAAGAVGIGSVAKANRTRRSMQLAQTKFGKDRAARDQRHRFVRNRGLKATSIKGAGGIGAALAVAGIISAAMDKQATKAEKHNRIVGGVGAAGGAMAGAALGQLAIPIPILGALIGAGVGAWLGEEGMKGLFGKSVEKEARKADDMTTDVSQLGQDDATWQGIMNEGWDRISRGITQADFDKATARSEMSASRQTPSDKTALEDLKNREQTAEGIQAANDALKKWTEARENLAKVARKHSDFKVREDDAGKKIFEELDKDLKDASEVMKAAAKKFAFQMEDSHGAEVDRKWELIGQTELLIDAQERLALALQKTEWFALHGIKKDATDQAFESNMLEGLQPMFKAISPHLSEPMGLFSKGQQHMRGINLLEAQRKTAKDDLKLVENQIPRMLKGKDGVTQVQGDRGELVKFIDEAGSKLKEKVEKAAFFFENSIASVGTALEVVGQQLDQVSARIVANAKTLLDVRTKGPLNPQKVFDDASDLGEQLKRIINKEDLDPAELEDMRRKVAQFDTGGMGKAEDMIAHAAKIPLEQIAKAMETLSLQGMGGVGADRLDELRKDPSKAQDSGEEMVTFLLGLNKADREETENLIEKKKALSGVMDQMVKDYSQLTGPTGTEEGKEVGGAIKAFAKKLKEAGEGIGGFEAFTKQFASQTTDTATILSLTEGLNKEAITAVKTLGGYVQKLTIYVDSLAGTSNAGRKTLTAPEAPDTPLPDNF
jgi:TP901 family phage tail tape measure protein